MTESLAVRGLANFPGPRLTEAFELARRKHHGQLRKGSTMPYIAHPLAVCALALAFGATEDEACAALLHDTAEDGGGEATLQEIRNSLGPAVANLVRGCSDSLEPLGAEKNPWRERKEAYLAHLTTASRSAQLVAAADKLHNLQSVLADAASLGNALWRRFKAPPEDQLWYYERCAEYLTADLDEPWSAPLKQAVQELKVIVEAMR